MGIKDSAARADKLLLAAVKVVVEAANASERFNSIVHKYSTLKRDSIQGDFEKGST